MVVFSHFVLLLCTLWELCARFLIDNLLFTDQKKKKKSECSMVAMSFFFFFLNK